MLTNPYPDSCTFFAASLSSKLSLASLPEEESFVQNIKAESRKKSYLLGRHLARKALCELDPTLASFFIKTGEHNEPLWPHGLIGSLSHSTEIACAIVSSFERTLALGIDVEPIHRTLSQDISRKVCDESEKAWVQAVPAEENLRLLSIFAAKEAIFKALFPLYQKMFWFDAVSLSWENELHGFNATLLFEPHPQLRKGTNIPVNITYECDHVTASVLVPQVTYTPRP